MVFIIINKSLFSVVAMDVNDLIRNKMIIKKPAKISNYKANDDPKPQRKVKSTARNAGVSFIRL